VPRAYWFDGDGASADRGLVGSVRLRMEAASPPVEGAGALCARLVAGPRERAVRVLRAVTVLGLCTYAAHSLPGLGGLRLEVFFESYLFNGLLFASAALCLLRAAWSPPERGAWAAAGVGLLCWALGEVLYTLDPSQVDAGFPAACDLLWLAFYPAAFVALARGYQLAA